MPLTKSGRYKVTRGPLKGRSYASENNYRKALRKIKSGIVGDIVPIKRYQRTPEYLKWYGMYEDYNGVPNRKDQKRFDELFAKAFDAKFERCPPANDVGEDGAPFAYLLDFIGARDVKKYGIWCVGDTPEVTGRKS